MRAVLVLHSPSAAYPWQIRLPEGQSVLGSDPKCDYVIDAPGVAPRHLEFEHVGDRVRLNTLGDPDETRIDGTVVREHWLRCGETIEVGPAVRVEFRIRSGDDAPAAPMVSLDPPGSSERLFQFLRGQVLFYTMSDECLRRIARHIRFHRVAAGEAVVRQGEPGQSFFLIRSGTLRVIKNGRQVAELGPSQYFGEVALLKTGVRTAAVVAATESDLYELDRTGFASMIETDPSIAKHFVRLLAGYGEDRQSAQEALDTLMPAQPRVGVALAAGAASGLVELGVLKVLEEEKIPIDMIAGCSVGAMIGGGYALTGSYQKTYDLFASFTRTRRLVRRRTMDFSWLPWRGFLKGDKILRIFREVAGESDDFTKLKVPFRAVAADLDTGREVVFREGIPALAVRASVSMPAAFQPVEIEGRLYVDGGVINPLPVNILAQEGMDIIIAAMPQESRSSETTRRGFWSRNFFNVLASSLSISVGQMRAVSAQIADVTIAPEVSGVGLFDYHRLDELIDIGERAAREQIGYIRQLVHRAGRRMGEALVT